MSHMFSVIPPKSIQRSNYICSSQYVLEPLLELYQEYDDYGVVLIEARYMSLYLVNQVEIRNLVNHNLNLRNKHHKGGSSSARFGRLHDNRRHRNLNTNLATILDHYYDFDNHQPKIKGLIIAGSSETKDQLIKLQDFQKYLKSHLIDCFKLNIPGKSFSTQIAQQVFVDSQDKINQKSLRDDQKTLEPFLNKINHHDQIDYIVIGLKETMENLEEYLLSQVVITKSHPQIKLITQLCRESGCQLKLINHTNLIKEYGNVMGIKYTF